MLTGDSSLVLDASITKAAGLQLEETSEDRDGVHGVLVLFVQNKLAVTASLPRPVTTRISCTTGIRGWQEWGREGGKGRSE